jgi:hypothetical protein
MAWKLRNPFVREPETAKAQPSAKSLEALQEKAENSIRLFITASAVAMGHLNNFTEAMKGIEKAKAKQPWFGHRWMQNYREQKYARKLRKYTVVAS